MEPELSIDIVNRLIELKTTKRKETLGEILNAENYRFKLSADKWADVINDENSRCIFFSGCGWSYYRLKPYNYPFFTGSLIRYWIKLTKNLHPAIKSKLKIKEHIMVDMNRNFSKFHGKFTFLDKLKVKLLLMYLFNRYRLHKNTY